jgi:RNA polymerase sigma-70 factor (ECF subfamily)
MKHTPHDELAALLAPHLVALFRAAYRLTGNRPDAEDLVQDVAVRAHAHVASLKTAQQPKAWLLKVQYRTFVDGVRRRRREPLATGEDFDSTRHSEAPTPEDAAEGSLAEQRVLAAWGQLDREQRALLALHVEGYTLPELEAITDLSTEVLKARLYRARIRLAKLLATPHPTPRPHLGEAT